jgi:hypothetical protein
LIITLTRDPQQPTGYCTLGRLSVAGRGAFDTIELPWVPGPAGTVCGHMGMSCIGVGVYKLEPRETEARGKHWMVSNRELGVYRMPQDIPLGGYGRSLVLIHAANWAHELLGCIAPGKSRGIMNGEWGVGDSRAAMNEIRTLIGNTYDLQLEIK